MKSESGVRNYDGHRIAENGEPTCKTCISFDGRRKCNSCDTHTVDTLEHNTCHYHLTWEKFNKNAIIKK